MIFSLVGSGLFLIGVIFTYSITGQLLFPQLKASIALLWADGTYRFSMTVAIGLMVGGLAIKSGLFPFHFWIPDTYGRATPASAGILSGVVSKGYIFLLIKIIYQVIGIEVFAASGIQDLLLVLGIGVPFAGLFGACSTMAEALGVGACLCSAGMADGLLAMTSSHFCTAERQFRTPLSYGAVRTPTAQWTATAAGACLLRPAGQGVGIRAVTFGRVQDLGIRDINNMGAAMAPACLLYTSPSPRD